MRPGTSVFLYRGSDFYVRPDKRLVSGAPELNLPLTDLGVSSLASLGFVS